VRPEEEAILFSWRPAPSEVDAICAVASALAASSDSIARGPSTYSHLSVKNGIEPPPPLEAFTKVTDVTDY